MHTNQLPHGNRPPPHLRGTAPLANPAGAAGRRTAPLRTQANRSSGRTPHPVRSTQTSPGPGRVLYTCVPHSHAQTNTHVRSCPGPVRVLYTRVPHSHAKIPTLVRPYVHGHHNPRAVRSQMGTTSDTRGTARKFSANTTPRSDRDRSRGPDHTGSNANASRRNLPSSRASTKLSLT